MSVLETIILFISLVTSIGSIVGIIYTLGVKFTKIEIRLDLLWRIFEESTVENLRGRGFVASGSLDHVTEKFLHEYEDKVDFSLRPKLEQIAKSKKYSNRTANLTVLIVDTIGYDVIANRSKKLDLPVGDYLTLLITSTKWAHGQFIETGEIKWPLTMR